MRADAVVSVVRWVTGTQRGYLALAAVASIVALASALVMQYGFGLPPCDLCIEQRWGFGGAGALAAGGLLVHRDRRIAAGDGGRGRRGVPRDRGAGFPACRRGAAMVAGARHLHGNRRGRADDG